MFLYKFFFYDQIGLHSINISSVSRLKTSDKSKVKTEYIRIKLFLGLHMVKRVLDLLEYLDKAFDQIQVRIQDLHSRGFSSTVITEAKISDFIKEKKGYYSITTKGYEYLQKMNNIRDNSKKSTDKKVSFLKRNKDKIIVGVLVGVIVLIIGAFFINPIADFINNKINSKETGNNFQPEIQLKGYDVVIFSPSNNYENNYLKSVTATYFALIKNPTKITFRNKNFTVNSDAFNYLNKSLQHENFTVHLNETFINVITSTNSSIQLNFCLNNFWIDTYYAVFGADIDLGSLTFEVELTDMSTKEIYTQEFTSIIKWIKES